MFQDEAPAGHWAIFAFYESTRWGYFQRLWVIHLSQNMLFKQQPSAALQGSLFCTPLARVGPTVSRFAAEHLRSRRHRADPSSTVSQASVTAGPQPNLSPSSSVSHCALAKSWNTCRMQHHALKPSKTQQLGVKRSMDRSQAKVWAGHCCTHATLGSGPLHPKQIY